MNNGSMLFGGIGMWIFWIALLVIVIVAVKALTGAGNSGSPQDERPMDILKKRLASGEISEEEYRRKRRELEH